jgi:hypothetical protein
MMNRVRLLADGSEGSVLRTDEFGAVEVLLVSGERRRVHRDDIELVD